MKREYLKNLSELILKRMGERKYTMIRFADEAGVSVRTMNNIMNKKTSITFEVVEKICDAHGFSLVDVFGLQQELDKKALDRIMSEFVLTDGKNNYKISPNLIKHR